jgi:hypothetical protein
MTIDHVLAVIPVADLTVSADWYERLFDAEATNRPMSNVAEWQLTDTGVGAGSSLMLIVQVDRSSTSPLRPG